MRTRHTGVNVPLFSLGSAGGWGIGEIPDLATYAAWATAAGFDRVMLLPLGTMPPGQTSPYSATSTLAIDPIYIGIDAVEAFQHAGGLTALAAPARHALDAARGAAVVQYESVRFAKEAALGLAFDWFHAHEWRPRTAAASDFAAFIEREAWWLDDYALFQALSAAHGHAGWRDWPEPLRLRHAEALTSAADQLATDVLRHQYWQWVAEGQWQATRRAARHSGVALFGDLPFVAGMDSPEIWARQHEFRLDVSVGTPPDAFSPTGQDWGLPLYDWAAIARGGFAWQRQRARRMAALYDGLRVDHVIGLYRTYGRPATGEPFFSPANEPEQVQQGEAVLGILAEAGISLIAEDLGLVPDFLRASLGRLGIPGCKVLRWERDWTRTPAPFIPPETYTPQSAAMTGTHDTEPLAAWWAACDPADRATLIDHDVFRAHGLVDPHQPWTTDLRECLLALAYRAGSEELFLPMQDLFGWPDRINVPGTVGGHNWTWRLPFGVDRMSDLPEVQARTRALRELAAVTGRS